MIQQYIARNRIAISKMFFVLVIGLILLDSSMNSSSLLAGPVGLVVGSGLVIIAVLGRLWSSLYLCGYKTHKLVDEGPFSMVRNPLYIFSLFGALGVGVATSLVSVVFLIIIFFVVIYPSVISNEERILSDAFGYEYQQYCFRTPRFVPNLSLFRYSDRYTVNLRQMHSAFSDVIWFFIALGLARVVSGLRDSGLLPFQL